MRLVIEIVMNNAAFHESRPEYEVARILHEYSEQLGYDCIEIGRFDQVLRDYNGQTVGFARLVDDED